MEKSTDKTPFIPTAMRCTEQQFEALKPKLITRWYEIARICDFAKFPFLVNNLGGVNNRFGNILLVDTFDYLRVIYQEWSEEIFLRNLGGEDVDVSERKINLEFTGTETEAMKTTIKSLKAIVDTQKLAIATNFETIAIKDEIIERLQSRIAELETTPVQAFKQQSILFDLINRLKFWK